MATVDDVIGSLQGVASNYGGKISVFHPDLDYNLEPLETSIDEVDSEYGPSKLPSDADAAGSAQDVTGKLDPFRDSLTDARSGLEEARSDLEQFLDGMLGSLNEAAISSEDFEPRRIYEMHQQGMADLMDKSNRWFDQYLRDYSPVTPANIAKANTVLDDMLDGLGLPPAILENIWSQTRDQAVAEAQSLESQAYSDFAARGYAMPPGALTTQLQNIRYQRYNKTAAASRDIAIKQAEIIIDLKKFGVETALSTYNDFVDATLGYLRAYIKSMSDLMASAYNDPISAKVSLVTGLYRTLVQGSGTQVSSVQAQADAAAKGGQMSTLPYDVQARLMQANIQIAGVEAEYARISADLDRANAQIRTRIAELGAQYKQSTDTTHLSGKYQLATAYRSADSAVMTSYGRIAATALSGLNAIASDTKISF